MTTWKTALEKNLDVTNNTATQKKKSSKLLKDTETGKYQINMVQKQTENKQLNHNQMWTQTVQVLCALLMSCASKWFSCVPMMSQVVHH